MMGIFLKEIINDRASDYIFLFKMLFRRLKRIFIGTYRECKKCLVKNKKCIDIRLSFN